MSSHRNSHKLLLLINYLGAFPSQIASLEESAAVNVFHKKSKKHKEKAENETTDQYVFFLATNHHFVTFSGSFFDPSGPDQPQTNDSEMWV